MKRNAFPRTQKMEFSVAKENEPRGGSQWLTIEESGGLEAEEVVDEDARDLSVVSNAVTFS